jgi:hypothetical protein
MRSDDLRSAKGNQEHAEPIYAIPQSYACADLEPVSSQAGFMTRIRRTVLSNCGDSNDRAESQNHHKTENARMTKEEAHSAQELQWWLPGEFHPRIRRCTPNQRRSDDAKKLRCQGKSRMMEGQRALGNWQFADLDAADRRRLTGSRAKQGEQGRWLSFDPS